MIRAAFDRHRNRPRKMNRRRRRHHRVRTEDHLRPRLDPCRAQRNQQTVSRVGDANHAPGSQKPREIFFEAPQVFLHHEGPAASHVAEDLDQIVFLRQKRLRIGKKGTARANAGVMRLPFALRNKDFGNE